MCCANCEDRKTCIHMARWQGLFRAVKGMNLPGWRTPLGGHAVSVCAGVWAHAMIALLT